MFILIKDVDDGDDQLHKNPSSVSHRTKTALIIYNIFTSVDL